MKKNSLFKVILIVLGTLILVCGVLGILGNFIPALEGKFNIIPIGDVFVNFIQSFYYFFDTVVYLLVLGAFYGVLNEVPAYKKLIENIVTKVKNHSKLFVFIVIGLFAILTSVSGQIGILLIFVPFVAAIVLGFGYDKLVAISSTVVSMLVGLMSSLYLTFRDPNGYYGYSATTIEGVAGVDLYANLWPKLILLVFGIALLIFFVNRHIKNVQEKKVKYELNESSEVTVSEVKGDYKTIRTWPMIVILAIILVLLMLGYVPWNTLFKIECFNKFNEWLLNIKIGDFAVLSSLISGNIYSFGNWASMGNYMCTIITLLVFTFIVKLIYRVKFNEVISNFVNGAKKVVPMILLVMLTYAILVCAYNYGFMSSFITWLNDLVGMNIGTATIISGLGALLHTDLYYTVAGVFVTMMSNVTDESMYTTYALTFQTVYGLVQMIAPTSLLVVFAVKYFDVPYTSFVKYIWRFVLMLLLLILLVLLVMALI